MIEPGLVERYRRVHRTGQDCRITTARNLLELHGHRHSYAMVQGLASSFYFTYRRSFGALDLLSFPGGDLCAYYWPVAGQRMEALENLAYVFDAHLHTQQHQDPTDAQATLLEHLRAGQPVMVTVSRASIAEYLGQPTGFPPYLRDVQFGGHYVLVLELDEALGLATVFDTDHTRPLYLPLAVLAEARRRGDGDPRCLMQSRQRMAVFIPPREAPPLAAMVRTALLKVAGLWRNAELAPGEEGGLPALRALRRELPGWCERADLGEDRLRATVHLMRMFSEHVAGGSAGRRMFGMFLRQAGDLLREPALLQAASAYAELTPLWQQLLAAVEARVPGQGPLQTLDTPEIRGLLDTVVELEQQGITLLRAGLGLAP